MSSPEPAPSAGRTQPPTLTALFQALLRVGLTAFGGPAMVNHIRMMVIERKGWLEPETFRDGVALCQTLPGAIAVNMAAYVGYRLRGLAGLACAFAGFCLPAFLLMLSLSILYVRTRSLPVVASLFTGLEVVVVAIVAHATVTFGRNILRRPLDYLIAVLATGLLFLRLNPFLVIILCGGLGVLLLRPPAQSLPVPGRAGHNPLRDPLVLSLLLLAGLILLWFADRLLFDLAVVMAKIELFAFGGGYTALTLMFHEVVAARAWMDNQTLMDGVALGQLTPGPILNTAAFIGYSLRGVAGALVGTLAIFAPGLVLIMALLPVFDRLRATPLFARAIQGVVTCFVGLLLFVTIKFSLGVHWDPRHLVLLAGALPALFRRIDLFWIILAAGLFSILLF